jgi:hypothetical protein
MFKLDHMDGVELGLAGLALIVIVAGVVAFLLID